MDILLAEAEDRAEQRYAIKVAQHVEWMVNDMPDTWCLEKCVGGDWKIVTDQGVYCAGGARAVLEAAYEGYYPSVSWAWNEE